MNYRTLLAALPGALLSLTLHAAPQLDPGVREMITTRVEKGELASVVVGIVDGEQTAVYGFGKAGRHAPDALTVYEIGSVSKTFTALLLAHAVAKDGVRLDDPVAALLPGDAIPASAGRRITLLDLATHTSGLPRLPANMAPGRPDNPYADYGPEKLKSFLQAHQLARLPGAAYEYSNLGYGLLGQALSRQGNLGYDALVQERIAAPLGLYSTGVRLMPDAWDRLAPGHGPDGRPAANWDMDALAGAGALRSNAQDMMVYLAAHMRAGRDPASPYAMVKKAQRPTGIDGMQIGLAWHLNTVRGRPIVWHNGATGGYASFLGFTADGQRGVVVLASTSASVDAIALASLVPGAAPPPKAIAMPAEALAAYAGRYQLAPGFVLAVTPAPAGLRVQATGQPAFVASASAADEFFLTAIEARLSFQRGRDGAVTGLVLHQNGHVTPAAKVD